MVRKTHYITMNSNVGCLPDNTAWFTRLSDAIDYLSDLFPDRKGVKSQLKAFHIAYMKHNEVCEIVTCRCDNPSSHNSI